MSDFLNPLLEAAERAKKTPESDLLKRAVKRGQKYEEDYERKRAQLPDTVPLSREEYDAILPAIANAEDPEETSYRLAAAVQYSKLLGKPLVDTYTNLEAYHEAWIGRAFTPKTAPKAIADSLRIGQLGNEYNTLGRQLKDSGGADPEIESRIAAVQREIEGLQDSIPRPWYVEALKLGAQSLPFTVPAAAAGLAVAGPAGALAGGVKSGIAIAALKAAPAVASGLASYSMMEGTEYADLRAAGVRHDIAAPISSLSAGLQAAVEATLGNVAGAVGKIGKAGAPTITGSVVKKLAVSGRLGNLGKALMGYAGEAIEEGAEEAIQEVIATGAQEVAANLQKEGVERTTAQELGQNVMEAFKGGFLASLVLGVPSSVVEYRGTSQESARVAELARTFDEKTFTEQAGKMNLSMFEGMDETRKAEALKEIWKAQQGRKGKTEAPIDPKVVDMTGPSVARPGPARRLDDGSLYVKAIDRGTKADLSEEAKLLVGDPKSGTQYGNITYRIDGDTVLVDNVGAADYLTDKSEVIHDALVELGAQHPGMSIEWTPATPELEAIRDRLISENPQGREAGLQWFTPESDLTQTRRAAVVGKAIRESFKTLSDDEVQSATSIVYETARSLGFRPEDVVGRSLELTTLDEIQKRPELASQLAEARGGMAAAQTERGATLFTQDGQMVGLSKASKEFERGMKGIIYAAKDASFSTFTHEWFHFIDVAYIGRSEKHRGLFEEALGKRYDDLTTDDREKLAYSFESYLQSGKAPTSGLKDLFKRIARAMSRAISALGRTMTISPQLKKGYDALFQGDSQLKQDASETIIEDAAQASEAVQIPEANEKPGKVAPERIGRAQAPVFERRNFSLRDKLVEDMSAEERAEALLLNELTIIPNRRAYADDNRKRGSTYPVQVSIDADSLKWINDHLGHAAGDAQLITIAEALKDAADNHGVLAYHVSGDEYIIQGEDLAAVKEAIAEAEQILSASRLSGDLELTSGSFEVEGFRFTYGINEEGDLKDADQKMEEEKRGREQRGERAPRGELPPNVRIYSDTGRSLNPGEVRELFKEGVARPSKDAGEAKGSDRGIVFQEAEPTDSEAFKEWFGDSKVVDEEGKPLVVYHGGAEGIEEFHNAGVRAASFLTEEARKKLVDAVFFTKDESVARTYKKRINDRATRDSDPIGAVYPVYLKISNPLEIDMKGGKYTPSVVEGQIEKAVSGGHDGMIVRDIVDDFMQKGNPTTIYATFSPTQIKSVTNRGTWDASDPRILFQESDSPDSPEFKAWFGESKVVDENGNPRVMYHGTSATSYSMGKEWEFDRFNTSSRELGSHFGTSEQAGNFAKEDNGRVYPVYLSISSPLRLIDYGVFDSGTVIPQLKEKGIVSEGELDENISEFFETQALQKIIRTAGYDGIIYLNRREAVNTSQIDDDQIDSLSDEEFKKIVPEAQDSWIAFDPAQVKSVYNRGAWSKDDPRILFQLTDPEIDAEARSYDSWEAWRDDVEATSSWMDTAKPEGIEGPEADAWYKSRWESAHAIQRDEQGKEVEDTQTLTSEEIDERFMARLSEDGELERFLSAIYDAGQADDQYGAQDEDEQLAREEAQELRSRIDAEIHPTIKNNAVRVGYSGRPLTDTARKSIMTLIDRGARLYRSLYVDLMGDEEFAALAENEEKTLPEIEDTDSRSSIVERMNLARRIKSEKVRAELIKGTMVPDDILLLIEELDKEKADLSARLHSAEKEIEEDRSSFTNQERIFTEQREKIADLKKEIDRNTKEIVSVEEELAKVRAREKAGRSAYALHVEQVKQDNRAKRKAAENSAAARREKLATSYEKKLGALRSTLQSQREEFKTLRAASREALSSARAEASLQKRRAIEDLKDKILAKEEERREAAKVIQLKRKLVAHIMQKPSKAIWYEYAEKIRAIQRTVDPQARKATLKWEGEVIEIQAFRERALNEGIVDILPKGIIKRLFSKSLDEWTIAELEEMSAEIDQLRAVGRKIWALKEAERKNAQYSDLREGIAQHSADPSLTNAAAAGSKERRDQLKKLDSGLRKVATATWTLSRIADWLDGGEKGVHTRLLVDEEREAYKIEMDNLDRRRSRVHAVMNEKGVTAQDLYENGYTINGIGPAGQDVTYTTSDLMFMYIGLRDPNTRAAIIYGNLMDQSERSTWDNHTLEVMGREKFQALESSLRVMLTEDEKEIAEEIGRDFRDEFGRLNDVFLNEFNIVMKQVSSYVPMIRQDVTASGEQHEAAQADELLNVAGVSIKRTPDKGFTAQRVKISPRGQRAIKLDLYGTWMDAAERQEHFAAYTRYIRKLNGVYKNTMDPRSRLLRHMITQTKGPSILKRVDEEINALANPQSFRDDRTVDRLVRTLRGNLGVGYLAWKTSSILKQAVTSPAPFLTYVSPLDMASSTYEAMQDPKGFSDSIKSKSAIMRHRVSNPIFEALKRAQKDSKGEKGVAWVQSIGMKGLELVDWVSVAVGWNAVYKKALFEGKSEEEAIAHADDTTLKCQPSAREQDLAPLFKTGSEGFKLITQFQTALNVIWNQFTYDLPSAIKRRDWEFVVRLTTSYAIGGIALGLLTEGLRGDDDDELRLSRFAYWSFSQALDSVPLIGSGISAIARQAITGEKERFYTSSLFPAADELISAAGKVTEGKWDGAAKDFAEGLGLGLGLPVSGVKEIIAAPDDPGRLIGRR